MFNTLYNFFKKLIIDFTIFALRRIPYEKADEFLLDIINELIKYLNG